MKQHEVLKKSSILVNQSTESKEAAIKKAGTLLVESGHVDVAYINGMYDREKEVSTFLGMGVAIPHGTNEAKVLIKQSGISITLYPEGADYDGNKVYLVIGIAGLGDDHLEILMKVAEILEEQGEERIKEIAKSTSVDEIYQLFVG